MRQNKHTHLLSRPALDKISGLDDPAYRGFILGLNPSAYWPLNDASGTAAVDLVAANNGVYTGPDLYQPQAPFRAPFFDGANDRVNVYTAGLAAMTAMLSEGTAMIWLKVYNAGVWTDAAIRRGLYLYTTTASDGVAISKNSTNNTVSFAHKLSGTTVSVNTGGQSSTGWLCLAATFSEASAEFKAYLNGAQTGATQTITTTLSANPFANGACFIGAFNSTPTQPWHGCLAHAALFDTVLSAETIYYLHTLAGA